jgi:hypothetical protein
MPIDRSLAVVAAVWFATCPSAVLPWTTTTDRGLTVFVAESPELTLSFVCDTAKRHGVDASALHLSTPDGSLVEGPTTFHFGEQDVSVQVRYGSVLKGSLPADQWQALASGLEERPQFSVRFGAKEAHFQVSSPLPAGC